MKKIIIGIFILLVFIFFCGCNESSKNEISTNDELDRFVGTWIGTYGIKTFDNESWIFYQNRSLQRLSPLFSGWGTYTIDENQLKIKTVGTFWYEYTFSDNDNSFYLEGLHGYIGNFTKENI